MPLGELAPLRVGRLDLRRRRALIAESVALVRSRPGFGTPTTYERRDAPIPHFLVDDLARHVAAKGPEDLVFPGARSGGPLRAPAFRQSAFAAAAATIGRACIPTNRGTPPRPWPSPPAPTSRSSSRCSATYPRR